MIVADSALASRLELMEARAGRASVEAYRRSRGKAASTLEIAGGLANFAGLDSPMTQAIAIGISTSAVAHDAELLEHFYRDHASPAIVHITPWTAASFVDELSARSYRIVEYNSVFARALSSSDTVCKPHAVRIEIATPEHLDEAARLAALCFAPDAEVAAAMFDFVRPSYSAEGMRTYLAFIDDRLVGAGTLFADIELKVAGLFGAATLPTYRGRGVQSALLERRLSDALANGCELAAVTTLPGSASHRNVLRRGFELLYTKFVMRK